MSQENRASALQADCQSRLKAARRITDAASNEGRRLEAYEKHELDRILESVEQIQEERKDLLASGSKADAVRSKLGTPDGWAKAARAFSRGETRVEGQLVDFMRKTATLTDPIAEATLYVPGVQPLLEDKRALYTVFPTASPGDQLHVQEFRVSARSASGAAVERVPTGTGSKSETNVTVSVSAEDLKQYASLITAVPKAILDAEPQLNAVLSTALQRELDQALDDAILAKIDAAAILVTGGLSTVLLKLRRAVSDIQGRGGNPTVAVIGSADQETIDNTAETSMPRGYPFGLTILNHPSFTGGDGFVFDPSGLVLYHGPIELAADPYNGTGGANFSKNLVDFRAEYLALGHIRDAGKFAKLEPSIVT